MNDMSACACLGPMWGEPECPCRMEGKERSEAYREYMKQENVDKREQELMEALGKLYGWKTK